MQTTNDNPHLYRNLHAMPFKVRASCGHIVIRKMREATAGVAYTPDVILDAPNGRPCPACEVTNA